MSREAISAARMILTRRESAMNTVEETKASLTNTMTPQPHVFMSNLNGGSGDRIDLPKETNERSERRIIIRTLGPSGTSWYKMTQRHI
jgi:hypothetical protein